MTHISILIDYMKRKIHLSDLETDLLKTSDELMKTPFDRASASLRSASNYTKYPEIFSAAKAVSGTPAKHCDALSDDEIRQNLQFQLVKLVEMEDHTLLSTVRSEDYNL